MKSRKRKWGVKYLRYSSTYSSDLKAEMTFKDKKQVKEAVETCRILKGCKLKFKKSDEVWLQVFSLGEGCKWT